MKLASLLTPNEGDAWTYYQIRDFLQEKDRSDYPDSQGLEAVWTKLQAWEDRFLPIYRPTWDADQLAGYARRLKDEGRRIGAVLVDYLQLVPAPEGDHERRDIEVSAVCRRLKALSVELDCPVLAAAQLGRQSVADSKIPAGDFMDSNVLDAIRRRRPQLHHVREGGSEQEADLVLGLLNYRADYLAEQEDHPDREEDHGPFEVLGLKSRYGGTGIARLTWEGRTGTLRDVLSSDDWYDNN